MSFKSSIAEASIRPSPKVLPRRLTKNFADLFYFRFSADRKSRIALYFACFFSAWRSLIVGVLRNLITQYKLNTSIVAFVLLVLSGCRVSHKITDPHQGDPELARIFRAVMRPGVGSFSLQPWPTNGSHCYYLRMDKAPGPNLDFLRGCSLSGLTIRDARRIVDISGLAECSLMSLYLPNGSFTNIDCLRNMPLREVCLSACPVRNIEALRGKELRVLDISGSHVESLDALDQTKTLQYLDFDKTPIKDILPLSGMSFRWLICNDLVGVSKDIDLLFKAENLLVSTRFIINGSSSSNTVTSLDASLRPIAIRLRNKTEGIGWPFEPMSASRVSPEDNK